MVMLSDWVVLSPRLSATLSPRLSATLHREIDRESS